MNMSHASSCEGLDMVSSIAKACQRYAPGSDGEVYLKCHEGHPPLQQLSVLPP